MLKAFSRLFYGSADQGQRRLTFDQARALANEVARKADGRELGMVMKTTTGGRATWHVSTSGLGHGWFVEIDDETGAVGPLTERHGR